MPAFKDWRHHTSGKRGGTEARGGRQDGEATKRGPSGAVDGKRQGTRVGQGRKVPRDGVRFGQFVFSVIEVFL